MFSICPCPCLSFEPDGDTKTILGAILHQKALFQANHGKKTNLSFAAFFDFDGTIIKGDITEGYKGLYVGLAERAVKKGLARDYSGDDGFSELLKKYEELLKVSHEKAYVFVADQFANLPKEKEEQLKELVAQHFREKLKPHLFTSSLTFIKELQKAGIDVYVISASPEIFVKGALTCIPELVEERVSGINRERTEKKRLVCPIVNYGDGKVLRIRHLLSQLKGKSSSCAGNGDSTACAGNGKTIVIAGFGNSWSTDGPFLRWINKEGGISVMINGGKSPEDSQGIWLVRQEKTVGNN